ncbi:MAG: hypothetical protein AAFX87_14040 [Bacteroidota bacterium]
MKSALSVLFLLISTLSYATETKVIVRAKAKDAKFIGTSIGGAHVMIKNKTTGEIMAQGKTTGSTGNTDLIMKTPHERGMSIADEKTAKFTAIIDITEPVFVRVEVLAPINKRQATITASTELWLIPGKHILGDGLVLEIPGFVVDILEPRTHRFISMQDLNNQPLKIKANLVMMCGCTISKGGLWDAEKMEVKAIVKLNDEALTEIPMRWVSNNLFEGDLPIEKGGLYELTVYAYSEASGNTGVDKVNYIINN